MPERGMRGLSCAALSKVQRPAGECKPHQSCITSSVRRVIALVWLDATASAIRLSSAAFARWIPLP